MIKVARIARLTCVLAAIAIGTSDARADFPDLRIFAETKARIARLFESSEAKWKRLHGETRTTLEERVEALVRKWPDAVRYVADARLKSAGVSAREFHKDVLVISTVGMAKYRELAFLREYLEAVAPGTVSVLHLMNTPHILLRFGERKVDLTFGAGVATLNDRPFGPPSQDRLESIIRLAPDEAIRFGDYIEAVRRDYRAVLGPTVAVSGGGHTTGKWGTRGSILNNVPLNPEERHNCCSFFMSAPIGVDAAGKCGVPLLTLLGASASSVGLANVYGNGFIAQNYVFSNRSKERFPFLSYWSTLDLESAVGRVADGVSLSEMLWKSTLPKP